MDPRRHLGIPDRYHLLPMWFPSKDWYIENDSEPTMETEREDIDILSSSLFFRKND